MRVTGLNLTNARSIMTAELRFQPGFNLVVGENGVGKTTLIEALAICLFEFERIYNRSNLGAPKPFGDDDIRVGAESLDVECDFDVGESSYHFVMHRVRGQSEERPERKGFIGAQPSVAPRTRPEIEAVESQGQPLVVMYSTSRAIASERWPPTPIGGVSRAFEGALADREVPLGYFTSWMKVKQALSSERSGRILTTLEGSVQRFLPGYENLQRDRGAGRTLLVDRKGEAIPVRTEDGAFSPTHSFGVDSSRVLEEIMEADPRTREVLDLLGRISREIDRDAFERARRVLDQLIEKVGSDDPEVTRIRTLLEFLDEDE